jgi:predicted acetyltransferase
VLWVIDAADRAVGMVRLRHFLNDRAADHGGHIGYFIKRDQRGRGYGTAALRHACLFHKTETPRQRLD